MNKRLRSAVLAAFAGVLLATAGFTMLPVTTYPVARNIPYFTSNIAFDSLTGGQPGGRVMLYRAADSLLIGDIVYISDTNKVAKSTTLANYNTIAGVVVGGARTSMQASVVAADAGTLAATANQRVWVLQTGRAWVRNDANATLAVGAFIIPSDAVAGKVEVKTSAIDTNYRTIGKVIVGGLVSTTVLANINVK